MPVILAVSQSSATTDFSGLASIVPPSGFSAPVEVDIAVSAGNGSLLDYPLEELPAFNPEVASPETILYRRRNRRPEFGSRNKNRKKK